MDSTIVLASNSPRRKELLRQIGLTFTAEAAHVDEGHLPGERPETYAVRLAVEKAEAVAIKHRIGENIIIAADTVVALGDTILGKPVDAADAIRMLTRLSGRVHKVISGLVVMDARTGDVQSDHVDTMVWFRTLTYEQILWYVDTKEPLDKAGAYGIQGKGALLIDRIEGCYFNVVGLPLSRLGEMLLNAGIRLF